MASTSEWGNLYTTFKHGVCLDKIQKYFCSYCNRDVASDIGMRSNTRQMVVAVCSVCDNPTILSKEGCVPGRLGGVDVKSLPPDIKVLYEEGRRCLSVNAYTAACHIFRKIIMNVSVNHQAKEGQTFQAYIDHLLKIQVITNNMQKWVDKIRTTGNDAAHSIQASSKEESENVVAFVGMLLQIVYEFPSR